VPSYELTAAAEKDLADIYAYTYAEFGEQQADRYFDLLEESLTRLASHPELGRDVAYLWEGYRMYVHRRHSVYYKRARTGILVIRVLGPGMVWEPRLV